MIKLARKILTVILCVALVAALFSVVTTVSAAGVSSLLPIIPIGGDDDVSTLKLEIDSPSVTAGEEFDVNFTVKSNPGVIMIRLFVTYDENVITLLSATDGGLFETAPTFRDVYESPYVMIWGSGTDDMVYTEDVLVTLHFAATEVCDEAINTTIGVSTECDNDIINESLGDDPVTLMTVGGNVTVNPEAVEPTAVVASAQLDLSGKIGVLVAFEIPDELLADDGAYVEMSYDGETTETIQSPLKNGSYNADKNRYSYKFPVAVKEIYEPVSYKMFDGEGNQIKLVKGSTSRTPVKNDTFMYAASDYIASKKGGSNVVLSDLVSRLEELGKITRLELKYKNTEVVEPSIPEVDMADLGEFATDLTGTNPAGIALKGAQLSLDADTEIWVKFTTDDASVNIGNYTFTCNGKTVTPSKIDATTYRIYIRGIASKNLDETYTVSVTDGVNTRTLRYSVLSYAYSKASTKPDDTIGKLGKALYNYNLAAKAYFPGEVN